MAREKGSKSSFDIVDQLLEPYYIRVSIDQFAVHKRIPSGHTLQAEAYCTTLDSALRKIAEMKSFTNLLNQAVESDDEQPAMTLKQYLGAMKQELNLITSCINDIWSTFDANVDAMKKVKISVAELDQDDND